MDHPIVRSLMVTQPSRLGNGTVCIPEGQCYCEGWLESKGTRAEKRFAYALQWITFALSVACLVWYGYQTWKATCGWEEVYVAIIEMVKFIIEIFHEFDSPATLWLSTGNPVVWLRYAEWLLTCPVILIHLSNLTGLKDDYSKRTMGLLVSDVGCIVWGATTAMSVGWIRILFYLVAMAYGMYTYFHAAKVYIEAYHTVPKGICRDLVRVMAWTYFMSWGLFPVLFVLGPEGFGHISQYGSAIAHAFLDLASKNTWSLLGNYLRVKIHEHILLYGDIRKKQKINIAGQEMEVETLVAEEDDDTVKQSTAKYASRESFIIMRNRLKEKGMEVRASLDYGDGSGDAGMGGSGNGGSGGGAPTNPPAMSGGKELTKIGSTLGFNNNNGLGGGASGVMLEPGRVILAVPDISMVDFFREQFAQLPVPYEVVPALGADNTVQLVQQAATLGGCDFVLMHPEFLRDRGPMGLFPRLKIMNQRTAAFGWSTMGPVRDLIESSGVDAWLEGPSFGAGINQVALQQLVLKMQQARRLATMSSGMMGGSMGMGMGMSGANGGGMGGMGGMGAGMGSLMSSASMNMGTMGNLNGAMGNPMLNTVGSAMGSGNAAMMNGLGMGGGVLQPQMGSGMVTGMSSPQLQPPQLTAMASSGNNRIGTNPLFGSAPSPLNSQPGANANGLALPHLGTNSISAAAPAAASGASGPMGTATEAEMLQQLMAEINRLKNELGE